MFFPAKQITREIQLHWMYSLRLLTYQLGSGNTTCGITTYVNIKIWIFVNRALTIVESKCVTFQFIYQLIWQFEFSSWFSSHFPDKSSSLGRNAWRLEQDFAPRQEPVAALHSRSVLCYFSHLTEDNGEIYMNTGVVELHNSLEKNIKQSFKLMNHLQHPSPIPAWSNCGPSSPVESNFFESSSTWTFFCHFLSPLSLRRIHGQGPRPRHSTKNCQHSK